MEIEFIQDGSGSGNVRFKFNGEVYDAQSRMYHGEFGPDNHVTIFKGFEMVKKYIECMTTEGVIQMFVDSQKHS